ncbi:MAG: PP2C family protein-serine/threonine phosphatase [Planctomycetes bacterium]|nr:PP2C family protein-serine/threonine phosphatase [Planctomycetota bacterium]
MMTPPPAGKARQSTGSVPAQRGPSATSAGAVPPVRTPPPPGGGGDGGGSGGGGSGGAPRGPGGGNTSGPPRPMARPKTQGLPIKTKIVVAMSGLTVGVSLLIFMIVMVIATNSLEDTIQQAGVGMLQQAEAIHRPYKAGLNEKGLIAYFSQPANREAKFGAYWAQVQKDWFDPRIPGCREFANWDQFKDDRIWVKCAAEALANKARFPLSDQQGIEIFGESWPQLRDLSESGKLPEPTSPRHINDAAMERNKHLFPGLFQRYSMDSSRDTFARLKTKIQEETDTKLIYHANGLRKKIFREFHEDFVRDLDEMTGNEASQVRFIIFRIPPNELPRFDTAELNVISPTPTGPQLEVEASTNVSADGEIKIDKGATVKGIPAYGFSKDLGAQESISIYLDRQEIESRKTSLLIYILVVSVLGIGLAILLAFLIGSSITKPLQTLMNDIQVISGGNFDHRPAARSRDEIGIVARLLGDMAAGLKSAQDVWLENQGRKHDLDIAKEIQENLLPKHVPRIAGYDVSAYYSPSKEVGGDYYDFFLVDKTHLGMVCADVSGKGIPGSMVMMMAKALVSYEASDNLSPRDIFCKVNRTLAKDIKRGMFVTAFYMLLDIPTARLTVASAGHNPLLLYRAATKQCVEVNPGGIALGFDKDGRLFERNMKEEVIQLQRGDRAVIYTDGVTEAMSPTNEEFGEERMQAITIQTAGRSSSEYLTTLVNAIQGHAQTDDQHDDITIVTLKVG